MFNNAGIPSLERGTAGNTGLSLIPGIQQDLTENLIENSKSQFPEYSNQYQSSDQEDNYLGGDQIQNFHLSPAGDNSQVSLGETGTQSVEGNTYLGATPTSRRAEIPKKENTRTKKQSVAYPLPYGAGPQPMVPLYGGPIAHPLVDPVQHLAVCQLKVLLTHFFIFKLSS